MTRVVLKEKGGTDILFSMEDPRTRRELVIAINTGELVVGKGEVELGGREQYAVSQFPEADEVLVTLTPPPCQLTRRQWQVLHLMGDGRSAGQIARTLRITRRTVYLYYLQIKRRFAVDNLQEMMALAGEYGMIRK